MESYLAVAALKAYLFDVFVWLCIGLPLIFTGYVLLKRKPFFILIFGILVLLSSLPVAVMSELSINGCCGAPSTDLLGIGYVIGGLVAIIGILIVIFRHKLAKKH